jgi:hypothetical protein
MKSEEINVLNDWILQQSEFNKNDLLVSVNELKILPFSENIPLEEITKIISISQNSIKESGINPFCCVFGTLQWEWNQQLIQTPIWITPCEFKIDKVKQMVHLSPQEEEGIINPFLVKKIDELFQIQLDGKDIDSVISQLKKSGFENINEQFSTVGNFHHHRYVLLKELEQLLPQKDISSTLHQYLSGEKVTIPEIQLPEESLLPYDMDHRKVMHLFESENCVVQGPPGTGKSQLLTNLVGKLLFSNQSMVFISEKRAALEVVKKRLSACGLDVFSVIVTDDLTSRDFITQLKASWELLDEYAGSNVQQISTRKELENNLQFVLDILNQPELIGGVSYAAFIELKGSLALNDFQLLAEPPLLNDYTTTDSLIQKIYENDLAASVSKLPVSSYQQGELSKMVSVLDATKDKVILLEKINPHFTPNDSEKLQYQSVVYQLFENELAKKYKSIVVPDSKEQRKFLKLYKRYKQVLNKIEAQQTVLTDWKSVPSQLELEYLTKLSKHPTFLNTLRLKKRWSRVSHLPVDSCKNAIKQLQGYFEFQSERKELEDKLEQVGISDFSEVDALKASLHLFSKEKWMIYNNLTVEQRLLMTQLDATIHWLKDDLKHHYRLNKNQSILSQLSDLQTKLPQLVAMEQELKLLNKQQLKALEVCESISSYKQSVLGTHQTIFQSRYPSFSRFEMQVLQDKIDALIVEEERESELMVQRIWRNSKKRFDEYHRLLQTPSTKLNPQEKELKQELKKGKAILVKEFSKTRQHPTLRELWQSEAKKWIQLLKPVWLTNPVQLAKIVPLEKELFDVCIMDEASQIPVQNGVGAMQRSKRLIVAGDEQQMNPMAYFQSGSKEVVSVLQHANYYLKKQMLTHHYRSTQTPLIAFSNRYFYENKLMVYPSFPINSSCVTRHFCENGRFIDRKNTEEAKRVVELIEKQMLSAGTMGVVAFSEEQVDAIWKSLSPDRREQLQIRMDENSFFIKPLEKVQGDECEHLIISLGYAPDAEDKFHLKFGPLNRSTGRNRLNVLFSRASKTIDFICSIESSVLQWSENESIYLLYKWLKELEQAQEDHTVLFPMDLQPKITKNLLTFKNGYTQLSSALELKTTYSVLQKRGWKIEFC